MDKPPLPTYYVKLPAAIAFAPDHDGLIVTMTRIYGLCWRSSYRRSSDHSMPELVELLGRPQATLYRHFEKLVQLGWLEVVRQDRRFVLQLLIPIKSEAETRSEQRARAAASRLAPPPKGGNKADLSQALLEVGIIGQPHNEMLHRNLSPVCVRAWGLWAEDQKQTWLKNPAGFLVTRLRAGAKPPPEFVQLAELTADEVAELRTARINSEQNHGWPSLDDRLRAIAPLWSSLFDRMSQEQRSSHPWGGSAAGP